jgi:hypothetical protein
MIRPENNHFGLLAGERNYRFGALAEPLKRIDDLTCCYGRAISSEYAASSARR